MKFSVLLFLSLFVTLRAQTQTKVGADTSKVINLNTAALEYRLTDPEKTVKYSNQALTLAKKINYVDGIAEAYRVLGIGKYYQNRSDKAVENYLISLSYFIKTDNLAGQAKVYNNIGNLYRDIDYEKGLEYFEKSLVIANELDIKDLVAGLYLNIGTIYQNKKHFKLALKSYSKSKVLFIRQRNTIGLTQCLQNLGIVHKSLKQLPQAINYLKAAINIAKKHELNYVVSSANLVLTSIYISQKNFEAAELSIEEGKKYSKIINDYRLDYDYLYKSYQLEYKRQNYPKALEYLRQIYAKDSTAFENNESVKIDLLQEQHNQQEKQRKNELIIAQQRYTKTLFWASSIVAGLSLALVFLLFRNVRKSAKTNQQLTKLNLEVFKQKENLNRINSDLEAIISERTKDLKTKNNKLSEYSSHLSHQVRSPISSLKGLMMLEKEQLIDHEEFIMQVEKCIEDIDSKIININEMLNDPSKFTLKHNTD